VHDFEVKIACFMRSVWFKHLNEIKQYFFHGRRTIKAVLGFIED
jgi:hypothetical protein